MPFELFLPLLSRPFVYLVPHRRRQDDVLQRVLAAKLLEHVKVLQRSTGHSIVRYSMEIEDAGQFNVLLVPDIVSKKATEIRASLRLLQPTSNHLKYFYVGLMSIIEAGCVHEDDVLHAPLNALEFEDIDGVGTRF